MSFIGVATTAGPGLAEAVWQRDGLAVTRGFMDDAASHGKYAITHIPSGRAVYWFSSKAAAIRAARRLLAAGDWTRPYAEAQADSALKHAFLQMVEAQP